MITVELGEMPLNFVKCKTFGHWWDEMALDRNSMFIYTEAMFCPRCTTKRYFGLDAFFNVINRQYVYPEGYKLAEKANRNELRKELANRKKKERLSALRKGSKRKAEVK
jgi:hypothetical protein